MTKQQTSLDSFLGTNKPKSKVTAATGSGPKQTTIASFFTPSSSTTTKTTSAKKKPTTTAITTGSSTTDNPTEDIDDKRKGKTTEVNDSTDIRNTKITLVASPIPAKVSPSSSSFASTKVTNRNNGTTVNDNNVILIPPQPTTTTKRRSKRDQVVVKDDEDHSQSHPLLPPPTKRTRKRRVIDDDSDDDDDTKNVMDVKMETVDNDNHDINDDIKTVVVVSKPMISTAAATTLTAAATSNPSSVLRTKKIKQPVAVMNDKENDDDLVPVDEPTTTTKSSPLGTTTTDDTVTTGSSKSTTSTTNNKKKVKKETEKKKKINPDHASTTTATATTSNNSTALKSSYKSNDDIRRELENTCGTTSCIWNHQEPIPYSIVCQTLSNIEQISSRLAIQDIMTTLLRHIILQHTTTTNAVSSSSGSNDTNNISSSNNNDDDDNNNNKDDDNNVTPSVLQKDLQAIVYIASNTVAPAYECIELGIGDALLMKAIGQATGTNTNMIKQKYETLGDLGTVAQTFKSKQSTLGGFFTKVKTETSSTSRNKNYLTAQEVLIAFQQIAQTKGNHSQQWKVDIIKRMLVRTSDPLETKYIIRGLQGKLRIGLAQTTVVLCIAHAFTLSSPMQLLLSSSTIATKLPGIKEDDEDDIPNEAKQYADQAQPIEKVLEAATVIVKKAYSEVPSFDAIIDAALKVPLQYFYQVCTLTPGIPVTPMLAKPTKSVQEVLKRLNGLNFTCEYKYDGERAQIHMLSDGTTKVFSRNLLDTSEKYPEVPIFVKEACSYVPIANGTDGMMDTTSTIVTSNDTNNVTSCVLDAEVVAWNSKTEQFVPFQILSTRKKTEESAETAKVQVIVQAFDLMYLNGRSLLHRTLSERRALLHKHFHPVPGKFQFAHYLDHTENGDTIVLEEFLENAVKAQCEGLMVKTLDVNAIYEPSRRSLNWLKLKKDYLEGLGDSVDLVPLGAYHGRGKRTGVYGAYLLACYDPDTEDFQSVCKIGTGFSDEMLRSLTNDMSKHIITTKSTQYKVSDSLECDVWFDTVQVWEVKAADLSKSSTHRGAEGKTGEVGRGIGLRFPRFERIRDDKRPDMATTSDQILEMYYQQDSIVDGDNALVVDDEEDGI